MFGLDGNQTIDVAGNLGWNWCDDNNFYPFLQKDVDWFNQYLSCFYWSLCALMKMPFVGPDTVLEKAFACFVALLGAILFALLLGQVTGFFNGLGKASAQLRDAVGDAGVFCTTRDVPFRLRKQMSNQITADFLVTLGMEASNVLTSYPVNLRLEVMMHVHQVRPTRLHKHTLLPLCVYSPELDGRSCTCIPPRPPLPLPRLCTQALLDTNPPFLRCSPGLKASILTLLKPKICLKKEEVVHGGHYGSTVYILMQGSLQVTLIPGIIPGDEEHDAKDERASTRVSRNSRASVSGKGGKMKDKLKVRILERSGAIIPTADVFSGAARSPFGISAVNQARIMTFEATALAKLISQYDEEDEDIVCAALRKEYNSLVDSLKGKPARGSVAGTNEMSVRLSAGAGTGETPASRREARRPVSIDQILQQKVEKLEGDIIQLMDEMDLIKQSSTLLPYVLKELVHRYQPEIIPASERLQQGAVQTLISPSSTPSNQTTPESSKRDKGGFFGGFSKRGSPKGPNSSNPSFPSIFEA